jgi:PTH2 family peptidyl-tRNA hydrolase
MVPKQVIVIRRDLKMRRGKEIAQGSHAAMLWFVDRWQRQGNAMIISESERAWLTGKFTKVVCQVDSEEQFMEVYNKAKEKNLLVYLVTDSGATEFHDVPTKTALCIGPDLSERIDEVTGNLKLY